MYLKGKCRQNLWPFQSGDLPTATDSALILLGFPDDTDDLAGTIQALELFSDNEGGYFPQLRKSAAAADQPVGFESALNDASMAASRWNDHWCQPDFGTTCFVRFHRSSASLPTSTPVSYLERGYDQRSSLFFANPYFIDWALALGLEGDTSSEAGLLREKLKGEILAGMLPDHSFGSFDETISSALAILALISLGYEDRTLFLACLSLAERVIHDRAFSVCAPFYSSLKLPESIATFYRSSIDEPGSQVVSAGEGVYLISYYLDGYNIIATALITLALEGCLSQFKLSDTCLAPDTSPAGVGSYHPDQQRSTEVHPRYRCSTQDEYIANWALAAFVKTKPGISDLVGQVSRKSRNTVVDHD